jgi:glutathione S-transferase
MGDDFTVPDLLIGHCLGWARATRWDIPPGPLTDYLARIEARPAYRIADAAKAAATAQTSG